MDMVVYLLWGSITVYVVCEVCHILLDSKAEIKVCTVCGKWVCKYCRVSRPVVCTECVEGVKHYPLETEPLPILEDKKALGDAAVKYHCSKCRKVFFDGGLSSGRKWAELHSQTHPKPLPCDCPRKYLDSCFYTKERDSI